MLLQSVPEAFHGGRYWAASHEGMVTSDLTSNLPQHPAGGEEGRAGPIAHEQAEAALRQSEADLAEAQRVAKLGSWRFDLATNAVRWSKELYRIFDIEEQAFGGTYQAFLACIHPDDRSRVIQATAEARVGGSPFEVEYRVVTRAGQLKTIREVGYAVKDTTGKVVGLFGTAQDITERKQVEQALQQANARLKVILDASPIPICGDTADGRVESWNEAAERVFGWSAKEAIGRPCPAVPPQEMQDYLAMIRRAMQGEPCLGLVRRRQKKDGSLLLCRISAAAQHNALGQPVGATVLLEDITEQAQAEAALRESEARLRLLDDNLPDCYVYQYIQEADGTPHFLYLSAGVERLHGVKAEVALRDALMLRRQVAPEQLTALAAAEAASLLDLSDFHMELRIRRADGEWRWVLLRSRPRRTPDGQVIWDGVATDITERKRAEVTVRESQQLLHLVLATLPVGVAVTDRAGNIVLANAASKRIWGDTIVSGSERWAQTRAFLHDSGRRIPPENWASVRALSNGETSLNECIDVETYDGQRKTILNSAAPIRNPNGAIVGAVFVNEDVTERVRAEEALHQLSGQLLRLQDEEHRRLARELHDSTAQNLAVLLLGMRRLTAQASSLEAGTRETLAECQALAEQCANEVRTFSYLLHPPLLEELGLAGAVRDYADGFAQRSGLRVDLEVSPNVERLSREKELALFRVLQESLANVHRHSGSKTVSIRLTQLRGETRLEVQDTGRGVELKNGPGSGEKEPSKLGVGVAGMRERLRQLGGRLQFESDHRGTTVRASLPLDQPGSEHADDTNPYRG